MKIHEKIDSKILIYGGLDDAFIGSCVIFNKIIAIYDKDKVIKIIMGNNNWTKDAAQDFYEYNIISTYVGELTPSFITYL